MLVCSQVIKVRCDRCGNVDKELFLYKGEKRICRRCITFKEESRSKLYYHGDGNYYLNYKLTNEQKGASQFILSNIKQKKNCVLNAVTGSGKTEIVYESIKYCIENRLNIAIVIPRRDVVVELYNRIKSDFKSSSVASVYGGNTKVLYADVIILTAHQLFRYNHYFDVIIFDEVDAFPYKGNQMLNFFLNRALRGTLVYMSATIPDDMIRDNSYFLNRRYHGNKLDVPKVKSAFFWIHILLFLRKHKNDIVLIYFPTIKEQIKFSKRFKKKHYIVNSKIDDRKEMLKTLHSLDKGIILTTLVLERGITFKNCHIIVYKANHDLFNYESLVQIAGRVGRKKDYPRGDILFLANRKNKNIRKAINKIKKANE